MVELIETHKGTVYAQRNGIHIPVNMDGLVGYWPMTEGGGGTAYDESKTGNTGTINGASWTSTVNGQALDFDGVDDYVDLGTSIDVQDWNVFTVMCWININVIERVDIVHIQDYSILLLINDSLWKVFFIGSSSHTDTIDPTGDTDTWVHLVGVLNGSELTLYRNATSSGSPTSTTENVRTDRSGGASSIGARAGITQDFTNGTIDEVRLYNRALSQQEITNIYEKTRGLYNV